MQRLHTILLAENGAQLPACAVPQAAECTEQGCSAGSLSPRTPGQMEVPEGRMQQEPCWHACTSQPNQLCRSSLETRKTEKRAPNLQK